MARSSSIKSQVATAPASLNGPAGAAAAGSKRKYISWVALAMMTTGSVASLRSAPTMAVFGLASVFLYIVPAIVFFVPTSLVSAELASGWKGGVFNWVSQGLSAPMGLLAIWCQFAMTIFYYPALLAYVASTIAYVFDPNLASNGVYTAAIIVLLYWGAVLVSSRGVGLIAKLASSGTVIGTLIPGAFLVIMGIVYLAQGNHSAAPMNVHHLLPAFSGLAGLVLVVNNFLAYSGMEMNAVHVDEMEKPARDFPKSIFLAMALVLAIFILPALVISWVVPAQQISLTAGVMQAFSAFFNHFGLSFLVPLIAIAMVVAMLSGMMAWLAGPSKGLLQIGRQYGYLPPYFQKLNSDGIQMHILVAQGVVISIIGLLYALVPDVSSVYWIFSVMTTQVYLIMYVLMFARSGHAAPQAAQPAARVPGAGARVPVRRGRGRRGARVPDRFRPALAVRALEPPYLRTAGARRGPGAGSAAARAALQAAQAVLAGPGRRGRYGDRERRSQYHGREWSGHH